MSDAAARAAGAPAPRPDDPAVRAAIEDLAAAYAHAIDDGELEAWPGFFTEDASYQVITRAAHEQGLPLGIITCEGRGMLEDRIKALRQANIFEPHVYNHLVGRPQIWLDEKGGLRARSNFQVVRTMQDGGMSLFAVGRYLDEIRLGPDGPRYRARRVVLDSRRVDILLVLPL